MRPDPPNGLVNLDATGAFRYNENVPAPVESRYMVSFAPLYSTGVGFFFYPFVVAWRREARLRVIGAPRPVA